MHQNDLKTPKYINLKKIKKINYFKNIFKIQNQSVL